MDFEIYKDTDFIPKNYFCKYSLLLDEEINWQVRVYRYVSIIMSEQIEFVLTSRGS